MASARNTRIVSQLPRCTLTPPLHPWRSGVQHLDRASATQRASATVRGPRPGSALRQGALVAARIAGGGAQAEGGLAKALPGLEAVGRHRLEVDRTLTIRLVHFGHDQPRPRL